MRYIMQPIDFVNEDRFDEMEELSRSLFGEAWDECDEGFDFNTKFETYIIAFCPDLDSWFVTNKRFFYYEYEKEFKTEEEGVKFFKANPKLFYDEEIRMNVYKPSFYENGVWLDNTKELILIDNSN